MLGNEQNKHQQPPTTKLYKLKIQFNKFDDVGYKPQQLNIQYILTSLRHISRGAYEPSPGPAQHFIKLNKYYGTKLKNNHYQTLEYTTLRGLHIAIVVIHTILHKV